MKSILMKLFVLAGLACSSGALEWHTCHGSADTPCPLQKCPDNGQVYACENEIRTHNGRYEVRKASRY